MQRDHAAVIAQLLAKAESTTEAEAEALRERAIALMLKYSIDEATLAARSGAERANEQVITERVPFAGIYAQALAEGFYRVAEATQSVRAAVGKVSPKSHYVLLVGYQSDVEQIKLLIASLALQAVSALNEFWEVAKHDIPSDYKPMEKFKERRQFLIGFMQGVSRRLAEARRVAVSDAGPGTELVLRNRLTAVDEFITSSNMFKTGRASRRAYGSALAQQAGVAAGRNANTGETAVGPRRRQIGG